MRVLLITDCFLPSNLSVAILVRDLAEALASEKYQVTVLVPDHTIEKPFVLEDSSSDGSRQYQIIRVKAGQVKGVGLVRRALNEMIMSFRVWRSAREWFLRQEIDGIAFYSPSIFWGPLVRKLKNLYECRAYLILRDIFPKWAVDAGVLRKGPSYWIFRKFERLQYEASDVVGVQSPANLAYFGDEMRGVKAEKRVLYNWSASKDPMRKAVNFRNRFNLESKYIFVYGGNLGRAQDANALVQLAVGLKSDRTATIVVAGGGNDVEWLERAIKKEQLRNVIVIGSLPEDEYEGLLAECDCGLITLNSNLSTHNIPGKLLSYLSAGLPVVAKVNAGNDLKRIVEDNGVGFVIDNGSVEEFVLAAKRIKFNKENIDWRERSNALFTAKFSPTLAAQQIANTFCDSSPGNA